MYGNIFKRRVLTLKIVLKLQVVDGNWGIHVIVPKWMFNMTDMSPYMPNVMAGSSKPASMTLLTTL